MNECERDHKTGQSAILVLSGRYYQISLQGKKWAGRRWVGSEYYESKPEHYWFEGVGTLKDTPTGRVIEFFTFRTWEEERRRDRELKDFVLASDRWDSGRGGYEAKLSLVESRRTDLVDHMGREVIRQIAYSKKLVPELTFEQMKYDWFVEQGFVFDETGQANLPDLFPSHA